MEILQLIFIAFIGFAIVDKVNCGKKQVEKRHDHHHHQYEQNAENHHSDKGYSIGSGLRSIADHSANQASSAVQSQHAAAVQAAYLAKNTLAQSAVQSAATALAALAGKEVLLQSLEHQREEAHKTLENEIIFLQATKRAAAASKQVSLHAQNQVSLAATILNSAQSLAEHAEIAVKEAISQLGQQSEMVAKAKIRLEQLENKLHSVQIDFEATKVAASKAQSSAAEAQNNASNAGKHATIGLNSGGYIHETISSGYEPSSSDEHYA